MGLSDTLKNLRKKAEDTAVEHKDQIHEAVQKAEDAADQRTQGKYHDKIAKAGDMADAYVEKLTPADEQQQANDPDAQAKTPPAA
jgi:ElaB/YqjD/DUF883 family membrane-anchored ribosome-binding protein